MSRVRSRRLFWELPPGATGADVYVGDPMNATFLADVDAGVANLFENLLQEEASGTELLLKANALPEGNYQFAVVSKDAAGNLGDPYQHPAWVNVSLDLTPPDPAFGGGLEFV